MINNEGIRCSDKINCYICGRPGVLKYNDLQDRLFGAPGVWDILYCNECDLMWINPFPVNNDVKMLYKNYFTHNEVNNNSIKNNSFKNYVKNAYISKRLNYKIINSKIIATVVSFLIDLIMPLRGESLKKSVSFIKGDWGNVILDYGCGNGDFLKVMKGFGWDVYGYDPDEKAVKVAKKNGIANTHHGDFKKLPFKNNYFDVITLNHVLEHLDDPIKTLNLLSAKLKKAGHLVIRVPNVHSLMHIKYKQCWRELDPPRHCYSYSFKSLLKIIEKSDGLTLESSLYVSDSASSINNISELIFHGTKDIYNSKQKISIVNRISGEFYRVKEFIGCRFGLPVGEELLVVAKKVK